MDVMDRNPKIFACGGCCSLATILICILASLRTVPAGHLGLVTTFGHVSPDVKTPGMSVCNPFAGIQAFSVKTTLLEQQNTVPTKEGLLVGLEVALLFRLKADRVYEMFTTVGENFVDVIIAPMLASEVRGLTSQFEAKALYGSGRELIQQNLTEIMEEELLNRGIVLENVLLREVQLPTLLKQSIEAKAQAEQAAERMKFVLQKERQEADRKTIEAKGIADFQRIVTEGITPSLLQWKGIEATELFTQSPNTKLVIMGNSQASLPVMLSGDTAAA